MQELRKEYVIEGGFLRHIGCVTLQSQRAQGRLRDD